MLCHIWLKFTADICEFISQVYCSYNKIFMVFCCATVMDYSLPKEYKDLNTFVLYMPKASYKDWTKNSFYMFQCLGGKNDID